MQNSAKSKAEQQFAKSQKKSELALKEKEKEQVERLDRMADLRALRLAKEAADKKLADSVGAEKVVAKNKKLARKK